jgi:Ni/Co efflux regulator RcnB
MAMAIKVREFAVEPGSRRLARRPYHRATRITTVKEGGYTMKKHLLLAISLALLSLSSVAIAKGKGHGHGGHGGHGDHPPGNHYGWHKGERIDVVYMQPRYYVEDYRVYHLAPPPPGHRWVRHPDGRMILVAVATGIIADILLHH